MRFALLPLILLASPLAAQDSAAPPPAKPLFHFPGLPEEERAPEGPERPHFEGQLFISPAGEPFRALPDEPYPVVQWFTGADSDHDGKLDPGEFRDDFDRFFAVLDVDHDKVIDARELKRYETEIVPEVRSLDFLGGPGRGSRGRGPGGPGPGDRGQGQGDQGKGYPGGPGGGTGSANLAGGQASGPPDQGIPKPRAQSEPIQGAGRYGLINVPEPVASMDINLDGRITPDEVRAAAQRRFALLDQDNHGYLTLRDLPETEAQRRGIGKKRRR